MRWCSVLSGLMISVNVLTSSNEVASPTVDVQWACAMRARPSDDDFRRWAAAALAGRGVDVELTIRVVEPAESRALNRDYRDRDQPTNVLSFPFEAPPRVDVDDLLGDLVICADVIEREAAEQGKLVSDHWAHMVVHGVLHLLGYDHQEADEAAVMEALEVKVLGGLGVSDPYRDGGVD